MAQVNGFFGTHPAMTGTAAETGLEANDDLLPLRRLRVRVRIIPINLGTASRCGAQCRGPLSARLTFIGFSYNAPTAKEVTNK